MLPFAYHPKISELAIKYKKHFFTSSYVAQAMKDQNQAAIDAGIILLNELGVNPGINHMSAMKVIDSVIAQGGKVISFSEKVGGLPSPQFNTKPFGYKFSWAPRGVLLASLNDAKFLQDEKVVEIKGAELFYPQNVHDEFIPELKLSLEFYANRDSLPYLEYYGIKDTTKSLFRGTFRNQGFCHVVSKLKQLGYLSLEESSFNGLSFSEVTKGLIGTVPEGLSLKEAVAKHLSVDVNDPVIEHMNFLDLFSDEKIGNVSCKTRLDLFCQLMQKKLQYEEGETDMIVSKQVCIAEYADKKEKTTMTLLSYGIPNGESCMARTVGLPLAIAVRLVLQDKLPHLKGLQKPTIKELYEPILAELETFDIKVVEERENI
jgi:saccharopine dehydrogenase-like NADP-dependent oxidoreductase